MTPGTYTELFFLDEATALADGHRPCAECRHAEFQAFQSAWRAVYPGGSASAEAMDAVLHVERREGPFMKRKHVAQLDTLPDGTYVELDERAWLVFRESLLAWLPDHYAERKPRPSGAAIVLTPPSIVAMIAAGYTPGVHRGAES
jgi:hypothetical protein